MADTPIDPRYSIGVPEMDAQHARWIDLIERFRNAASGHLVDEQGMTAAQSTLEQLLQYTRDHFASEERFIAAQGYPDLERHKQKHRELDAAIAKLLDEIRAQKSRTTPIKLNLFVTIWLMEHIMTDDLDYARFIRSKATA